MTFEDASNETVVRDSTFIDVAGDHNSYYVSGNMAVHHGSDDIDLSPLLCMISPSAAFDSGEKAPSCLPGTRKPILQSIGRWIDAGADAHQGSICWLRGPAGAGKTAVAYTVAAACAHRKFLAASYFFARDRPERNTIHPFIPTLAYQLSISIPEIRPLIVKSFRDDPSISSKHVSVQIQHLLVEPFQNLDAQMRASGPNLIIIDGMDECKDVFNQTLIITQLLEIVIAHALPLRFLIVSRPEPHIEEILFTNRKFITVISLDDSNQAKRDIEIYLRNELSKISISPAHAPFIKFPWPPDRSVKLLAERSGGCFVYASTSLKFIGDPNASPIDRLNAILRAGSLTSATAFAELDKLYIQILSSSPKPNILIRILGVILVLRKQKGRFLHLSLIAEILRIPSDELSLALRGMHSLINHDPDNLYSEVYPHHVTFSDFLFDSNRSKRFYVDARRAHYEVIKGCLLCMKTMGEQRSIFTMRYEHYGLLNYIYGNLVWHFHKAEDHLLKSIELIKDTRENVWFPVNYTADLRFDDPSHVSKIICLLHEALQIVKSRGPPYQAFVNYFHALRDTAFRRFLVPKSDTERLSVYAIVTLYENFSDSQQLERAVCTILQHEKIVTRRFSFIHKIISDSIRHQPPPEASDTALPAPHQLKEDLRNWLINQARLENLFPDPETLHGCLAHGCMALLSAEPKELGTAFRSGMKDRDPVDAYARRYWAKHISHASPGNPKLLKQLRNTDRRFFFNEEYLESIDIDDSSVVQHFCFCSSLTADRRSRHSHECLTTFRRQDYFKAKTVLDWLRQSPNPPLDLIKLWASYCEEKEWYAELDTGDDEDVYTIVSHSSDDSSYLNHFREWWRNLGE